MRRFVFATVSAAASSGDALRSGEPLRIDVPGHGPAFYFPPRDFRPKGRGLKPVLMYLHGRGGNAAADCRKWARVGTEFGWVLCPQGQEDWGAGRTWSNNAVAAQNIAHAALHALQAKYRGRVQLRNNILMGFSEGAFVAMQIGVRDPKTWNRWLILAANDQYWWGDGVAQLKENARKIKGVYLLTGQGDEVAENTKRVGDIVKSAKIPVQVNIAPGLGHELAADRLSADYRRPLAWLAKKQ